MDHKEQKSYYLKKKKKRNKTAVSIRKKCKNQ